MKVSLIVVCHHSSGVLPSCIASFRAAAAEAGAEAEVIAVEQSEDDAEVEAAAAVGPDRLLRCSNRGYAAGLNSGAGEATGEVILLANPDIEFLDGSVAALVDALGSGADIAGPQLLWDRGGEVLLPIADDPRPLAELVRTFRHRWPALGSVERRVEASWRVWTGSRPTEVASLRGPLMAVGRPALERFGPLDEGYFLYYEETEWLLRAARRGARLRQVPTARVVHRWGHSTVRRSDLAEIEDASRQRFFARNYPAVFRALLRRLASSTPKIDHRFTRIDDPRAIGEIRADAWLLSIVDRMEPFVGCLGVRSLPPAALELVSKGRWYAVAARRSGRRWRRAGAWMWESE